VPLPELDRRDARLELARRYLHVFGPTTAESFSRWAGIGSTAGREAFDELSSELTAVRMPIGDACILAADEATLLAAPRPAAPARLLPSGDAYFLLQGAERELLVPEADRRAALWTSRVWPGALLVGGDVVGVWRRANEKVSVETWRRLSRAETDDVEAEAASLPLPGVKQIRVSWAA
jgi:hypothetical protein